MADADVSYPRDHITAGILAGGRATRMGGVDKGLVELDGRAMVEYALAALQPQAAEVLVSANRNVERYASYGVRVVGDAIAGFQGPLAGIASLMAAARTPWLLVAPCDGPFVPADLGERLWRAALRERRELAAAHDGRRLQPAFALLRTSRLADLQAYLDAGERRVDRWFLQEEAVVVDFSDRVDAFVNVNTPRERDRARARLRASAR